MARIYKKCIALLLCVCLFAGCGEATTPPDSEAPSDTPSKQEQKAEHVDNVALSEQELSDIIATRTLVDPAEMPPLTVAGTAAVYDEVHGAYFFTVKDNGVWEDLTPALEGYEAAYTTALKKGTKETMLTDNEPVTVVVYNDKEYMELPVLFT